LSPDVAVTPTPATKVIGDDVGVLADDYDSLGAKNGSICAGKISDCISEVKGNGACGDANGVIGTLDFIYRQNFNRQYPRWRSLLIWDSGPTATFYTFCNNCRINQTGPDGCCGI
jgi:hypothetical protein